MYKAIFGIVPILSIVLSSDVFAKICRKGIPCGNSCIAAWKTCHVGQGTAISDYQLRQEAADKSHETDLDSHSERPSGKQPEETDSKTSDKLKKLAKYTFRSGGSGFFLCNSSEGKTLKCNGWCSGMAGLNRGIKLEFLDNFSIVEFEGPLGPQACNLTGCTELKN